MIFTLLQGENHLLQHTLSRKASALNQSSRGVPGSLSLSDSSTKVVVFYPLYYIMSKCGKVHNFKENFNFFYHFKKTPILSD